MTLSQQPTTRSSRSGLFRRALRIALLVALVFLLLPYLLTPLYRVVDPVSTLMPVSYTHLTLPTIYSV